MREQMWLHYGQGNEPRQTIKARAISRPLKRYTLRQDAVADEWMVEHCGRFLRVWYTFAHNGDEMPIQKRFIRNAKGKMIAECSAPFLCNLGASS
jgi:hypothetical protein